MEAQKPVFLTQSILDDSRLMEQLQERRWERDQAEPLIQRVLNEDCLIENKNFQAEAFPQKNYVGHLMEKNNTRRQYC